VARFEDLKRRYPALPQEQELSLLLGAAHETWGEPEAAGRLYREIDLMHPGSPHAATARARLARLRAAGVEVRELSPTQQVDRAARLVRSGPMDAARAEVARLRAAELPRELAQQVARSAARLARVEGRWEDASRLLREAQGLPDLEPEEREAMADRARDLERAAESRELEDVRRRIRSLTRGRSMHRQPTARLFAILRMSARAGLREEVDAVLEAIRRRDRIPPGLRFDAGILAAGTGSDELVADLFESAFRHPVYGVAARYHHARTLERMGRVEDARTAYARVIAEDSDRLPYYAMWARQRLRATALVEPRAPRRPLALFEASAAECGVGPFTPVPEGLAAKSTGFGGFGDVSCTPSAPSNPFVPARRAPAADDPPDDAARDEGPDALEEADALATAAELGAGGLEGPELELSPEQIVALLTPVAEAHGEAFPWLPRAVALIRLGELRAASDELHEAYTAWRDARGRSLRCGLMGVLRDGTPPRHRVSRATWRARRGLSSETRQVLARASAALGDHGLAIRFDGGFGLTGPRPRAYEDLVEAAAERHGIEPELLFAVMRVESVYNPRIISYAGAIGLAQIMPRTGRLIAQSLGRDDFTIDQLLEPEVNLEFAAWYLSSLIERFDGRVPLAVASYNGGPHNVRRWMRDHADDMPLDAFLERIPFTQTHRYVRRVLTHYEAYKAQDGASLARLDTTLPEPQPDPIAF
jgi:soluble lytic murein transglycosylase